MKRKIKKVILIVLMVVYMFSIVENTLAITVAQTGNSIGYIHDLSGDYLRFAVKTTNDGRYAYCTEHSKSTPSGQEYYASEGINAGLTYILKNGFPNVSFTGDNNKDYYITQAAVHYYLGEIQWISLTGMNDSSGLLPHIMNLVNGARNAMNDSNYGRISIDISPNTGEFKMVGDYFETEYFNCAYTGILTAYTLEFDKQIDGIQIIDGKGSIVSSVAQGESFKLRIHKSNVEGDFDLKIKAKGSFVSQNALRYVTNNSYYQNVILLENQTTTSEYDEEYVSTKLETYGSIKIVKKDKETGSLINGTKFNIKSDNGYDSTITVNGETTINNLKLGKYTVTEVEANQNYVLDKTAIQVTVEPMQTKTVTFENKYKTGSLMLTKSDKDNSSIKLDGVVFELYNSSNTKIGTYATNKNGQILVENLKIGSYKWKEVAPKAGYVADNTEIPVVVEYNKTNTITLTNEKEKGQIRIVKQDKDYSNIRLANVIFEILDSNKKLVETLTTNSNGEATSSKLPSYGMVYYIKEKQALSNYVKNETEYRTEITKNKITDVIIKNEHKTGSLMLTKSDKDNSSIKLDGVVFELYDSSNIKIGIYTTDKNGQVLVENLKIGSYKWKEVAPKAGYVADNTEIPVVVEYNKTNTITLTNEKEKGQIRIVKQDKDYSNIRLANVIFEILDSNKKLVETLTTNNNGEATSSKLPSYGMVYYIKEKSTLNTYVLNEETYNISLQKNKIVDLVIENEHKKGTLKIYKVDLDNNQVPVEDVEFEITDQEGYKYTGTSNQEGTIEIANIRTGIATIKETKTNKIYKLNTDTFNAEIKWNEVSEITIQNEKLKGQIEVFKIDAENKEWKLEGVKFQVINSNNELVETITTNSDGHAITSRIPIGEYTLKEVKTDEMHILNEQIFKVDVTTDIISKLEITNERIKGQIKVIKTSEDDNFINTTKAGTTIKNVVFEVYDSNNNLVDEIITNDEGIAITRKLDKGIYTVKEHIAGEWYLLNDSEFSEKINVHSEIVELNITNESEKPSVDIEKIGIIQTTANEEIRYDFNIKNTGNVSLSNFTWYDYIPTDYIKITRLATGTYNQDLEYGIYYKTNLSDYKLLKRNLNTKVNNYIDFTGIELQEGEFITEFKIDFGTVGVGFESEVEPYMFATVNSTVKNDDSFINKTRIEGYNKTYLVFDEDDHETVIYEKHLELKKLPRTGK